MPNAPIRIADTDRQYLFGAQMLTPVRLAIGLLPLVQALTERRVAVDPILDAASIPKIALDEPSFRISIEQELKFTRLALRHLEAAEYGLRVGRTYRITMLGVLGLAASTAPTALDVFHTAMEHPLLTWSVFHLSTWRDRRCGYLVMEAEADLGGSEPFFAPRDMACAVILIRDATGKAISPEAVSFRQTTPTNAADYEAFFECPVTFNAARNEARYPLAAWSEPLPQANAMLQRFFLSQCRQLCDALTAPLNYTATVRARLATETPIPAFPEIARAMNMAERTLQRRLGDEGARFSEILREVRRERADAYLRGTTLSIDVIAERLGYTDPVAFSRAFKEWTGMAPSAFRKTG